MDSDRKLPARSSSTEIAAFFKKADAVPARRKDGKGRLIFALDATASRQPRWAEASRIQADMFREAAAFRGLSVQLVHYGGAMTEWTQWIDDPAQLLARMEKVRCRAGFTRIAKVLDHALDEAKTHPVDALVFIGDCMEEEADLLYRLAGEMGLRKLPAFLFHEGGDHEAARAFGEIARLSGGAALPFDATSPAQLRDLLSAVAVYASGGRQALQDFGRERGGTALLLAQSMKPHSKTGRD